MGIQAFNTIVLADADVKLERRDLGTSPLGTIGNLQFKARHGGSIGASRVGVMLSNARRLVANLAFFLTCMSSKARTQRADRIQVRENSRRIGDLLGMLTAAADDAKAQSRIAQKLTQLAEASAGDLSGLLGGEYCLSKYLDELSGADLQALRNGVLGSTKARGAVLARISSERLRGQASDILKQIGTAVHQQPAKNKTRAAFMQLVKLLSTTSFEGQDMTQNRQKLEKAMADLDAGLAQLNAGQGEGWVSDGDLHLNNYLYVLQQEHRPQSASTAMNRG